MEAIKSYADLEQSKKLAEILPLESADMWWSRCAITDFGDGALKVSYAVEPCNISQFRNTKEDIPCWSLAALLGVLPEKYTELIKEGGMYRIIIKDSYMTCLFDNPIDACYDMIIHLNELKML